jgi:hypothetical protein
MPLTEHEYRILQAGLRFALDQIEEAEAFLTGVQPRTHDLAGQLARLKEIRVRIEDERQAVAAQLQAIEVAA